MPTTDKSPNADHATRRARRVVLILAVLVLAFVAGTVLAPAWIDAGNPWGGLLHACYSPLCHQQPERSLEIGSATMAVCARCSGLYLGGVAGLFVGAGWIVGRSRPPRSLWLALFAAPTFADAVLAWLGLPSLPSLPRLLLAWPVGWVAALYLAWGIGEMLAPRTNHENEWITRRGARESVEVVDG